MREPEIFFLGELSAYNLGSVVTLDVGNRVQIGVLTNIQHTNNLGRTKPQTFVSIEGHDTRWSGHMDSDEEITVIVPYEEERLGALDIPLTTSRW